jgi:hypothetical protein
MSNNPTQVDASDVRPALRALAKRLKEGGRFRAGNVVFRLGRDGDVHLDATEDAVSVVDGQPTRARGPRAELIGDARIIRGILEGKTNARARFLAGGFRVRGDLRYLSELAMELGLLDKPI